MANSAATTALGARPPVIRRRTRNSRIELAACNRTLVAWVSTGVEAVKLAVQHVRDAGQWVPVPDMAMGEGPSDPLGGQATLDVCVLKHVRAVVVGDEVVPDGLTEHEDDREHEKNRRGSAPDRGSWPAAADGGLAVRLLGISGPCPCLVDSACG